jgi:preprotein translocase subunit SecD
LLHLIFLNLVIDLLNKKINLGLDLQGGSYLLLEIDNTPVIEQKLQNLTITIRNYFKEKNIRINNLKLFKIKKFHFL